MTIVLLAALFASPTGPGFRSIRIIATGDLHSRVLPSADFEAPGYPRRMLGGWAGLRRTIEEERTDDCLLLDCGDFAYGSVTGCETYGRATIGFMNSVGYDAAALGASDFRGGVENVEIMSGIAEFPLLADPMLDVILHRRAPLFRPFMVVELAGVRTGVVGLLDPAIPHANLAQETRGLVVEDPASQLRRYLPALRAESVDAVVCFGHVDPETGRKLLDSFPELDLVVCPGRQGATGRDGLAFVSPYGQRVTVVDLLVNVNDHRVYSTQVRFTNVVPVVDSGQMGVSESQTSLPRAETDTAVVVCQDELSVGNGRESELGHVVAEAVLQMLDADVVLLSRDAVESGLPRGVMTRGSLYGSVPYAERLRMLLQDEVGFHRFLGGLQPDSTIPLLAGVDLFVLGDTSGIPRLREVARARFRERKSGYRVVANERVLERAGVKDEGTLVARDLSSLWVDWASQRDTLFRSSGPRLFAATAGLDVIVRSNAGPVNINSANVEQLESLPGIGPKTAQRIVEYRREHGPFRTVDDVALVRGIGPKRLEALRPLVVVK